jgi:formate dehydrogenase subunit gamma
VNAGRTVGLALAAWVLAAVVLAAPAHAQAPAAAPQGAPAGFVAPALPKPGDTAAEREKSQPGNNAPIWRAVRNSGAVAGTTSLPGAEKGVLIQSFTQYPGSRYTTAGEAWREVRNRWILPYGGSLLLIVLLALALFYFGKGPIGGNAGDTGRVVERFTPFERAAHWSNAVAFVLLALSGIVMAFGKFFLLPILGSALFGWLTYALKTLHNFVGPLFVVSLVVVLITFVRDNLPRAEDLAWIKRAGGLFGAAEVPSHRFNAGEKAVFWGGVFVLGFFVAASGLVLDQLLPDLAYLRGDMQVAHMVHATAAVLMIALFAGHIYMGTVGMKGAYAAMRTGFVDEAWGDEHHALWMDDVRAGKIPAQRSAQPAPVSQASARPT